MEVQWRVAYIFGRGTAEQEPKGLEEEANGRDRDETD
jgi:hypothetical protein